MSLSAPNLQNPAKYFFDWKNGHLEFYDRDQAKTIPVPFPFEFIVLDQLNGIAGWSDKDNARIWSNETRSTRDDFTVRAGKRVIYVGPYKNEQGISQVAGFGGRYCKIVYFALHSKKTGEWLINRLRLTGAAMGAWIDFTNGHNVEAGKVRVTGAVEGQKGATTYQMPVFAYAKWTDEEYQAAVQLDQQLQTYLNQVLSAPKYADDGQQLSDELDMVDQFATTTDARTDITPETPASKAPRLQGSDNGKGAEGITIDDLGGQPVNLDDIPF